ncbi:VOC family protein [Sphingomonas qilianensis]|uniref:VOC family protein n=1 Tax=Sphingomonas qilianensis TaxID=1736690 RepID=A0ABU9XQ29_9SPHN
MPVLGIGGLFFRANDPDALNSWYREHLGIGAGCVSTEGATADDYSWQAEGGPVVFAPFQADSEYFAADKQFMLNLRVRDLDSLLEQLNASGIEIVTKPEWNDPATGQFARIHDPEGNAIELWEPPV